MFKNPLRSRPYVISKEAPHRIIGSHEILRADLEIYCLPLVPRCTAPALALSARVVAAKQARLPRLPSSNPTGDSSALQPLV
ncbi:MAG TPA: hypothetical protein VGC13_07285 [Longimicrobium sp.]|uniref:hypothetical protein n=1 Tax=Longimicrobium sp. TaxID=2029185 RepID=UPI002ED7D39A